MITTSTDKRLGSRSGFVEKVSYGSPRHKAMVVQGHYLGLLLFGFSEQARNKQSTLFGLRVIRRDPNPKKRGKKAYSGS